MPALELLELAFKKADTPEKAHAVANQCKYIQGRFKEIVEEEVKKADNDPTVLAVKDEVTKHYVDGAAYYERAALIKEAQLKAEDKTDSTGEVAKYIDYGRQSYANFVKRIRK